MLNQVVNNGVSRGENISTGFDGGISRVTRPHIVNKLTIFAIALPYSISSIA
jgi:hypothetical protein